LKPEFVGHQVATVAEAGLTGLKNGQLLSAASPRFDVLVTVDQNLTFQQNLRNFDIAILVLRTHPSTFPRLRLLMPEALKALETIREGEIVVVE